MVSVATLLAAMDIVTHAVLGASVAIAASGNRPRWRVAAVGAVAACTPDLDVLIRDANDPLLTVEIHRHVTHSLVAVIPLAAIVTFVTIPFWRSRYSYREMLIAATLAIVSAVLLDACTGYGTHLLWPFNDERLAASIISVIDPLFTIPVLGCLLFALFRRSRSAAIAAVVVAGVYLGIAVIQKSRVDKALTAHLSTAGVSADGQLTRPSFANVVLWRGVAWDGDRIIAVGLRAGLGGVVVYPGEIRSRPSAAELDAWAGDSVTHQIDVQRFADLSGGLLVVHPSRPTMLGDARYAMLPTSLEPLWGIEPGPGIGHVRYVTHRRLSDERRGLFIDMIKGVPPTTLSNFQQEDASQ